MSIGSLYRKLTGKDKDKMIEIVCKSAVFHFNKKHLEDPTIPMWVVKANGKSFYVAHVTSNVPWSTKETPENSHTKGSLKVKNCLLKIDNDNSAEFSALSEEDKERLKEDSGPYARIEMEGRFAQIKRYMDSQNIRHSPLKMIKGGCGESFYICDIFEKSDLALLALAYSSDYRILQPNEEFYKWYDAALKPDPRTIIISEDHDDYQILDVTEQDILDQEEYENE